MEEQPKEVSAYLTSVSVFCCYTCTATAIPFINSYSGNCAASAPISTFMCLWEIYIFPGSVHIFSPAEKADPSWEYLIRSQTHECGNWDWDPNVPFLGIFVSNFRHFVFAVCYISRWLDHCVVFIQYSMCSLEPPPSPLKFSTRRSASLLMDGDFLPKQGKKDEIPGLSNFGALSCKRSISFCAPWSILMIPIGHTTWAQGHLNTFSQSAQLLINYLHRENR